MKGKEVYRSRIDLWMALLLAVAISVSWISAIGMPWWYWIMCPVFLTILVGVGIFGCWYEIEGTDLIVYQFCRPTRLPIMKIKSVRKMTGFLATAACSTRRVSIAFTDRKVLKSYAPLEISPKDRDGFIALLRSINPSIEEISGK